MQYYSFDGASSSSSSSDVYGYGGVVEEEEIVELASGTIPLDQAAAAPSGGQFRGGTGVGTADVDVDGPTKKRQRKSLHVSCRAAPRGQTSVSCGQTSSLTQPPTPCPKETVSKAWPEATQPAKTSAALGSGTKAKAKTKPAIRRKPGRKQVPPPRTITDDAAPRKKVLGLGVYRHKDTVPGEPTPGQQAEEAEDSGSNGLLRGGERSHSKAPQGQKVQQTAARGLPQQTEEDDDEEMQAAAVRDMLSEARVMLFDDGALPLARPFPADRSGLGLGLGLGLGAQPVQRKRKSVLWAQPDRKQQPIQGKQQPVLWVRTESKEPDRKQKSVLGAEPNGKQVGSEPIVPHVAPVIGRVVADQTVPRPDDHLMDGVGARCVASGLSELSGMVPPLLPSGCKSGGCLFKHVAEEDEKDELCPECYKFLGDLDAYMTNVSEKIAKYNAYVFHVVKQLIETNYKAFFLKAVNPVIHTIPVAVPLDPCLMATLVGSYPTAAIKVDNQALLQMVALNLSITSAAGKAAREPTKPQFSDALRIARHLGYTHFPLPSFPTVDPSRPVGWHDPLENASSDSEHDDGWGVAPDLSWASAAPRSKAHVPDIPKGRGGRTFALQGAVGSTSDMPTDVDAAASGTVHAAPAAPSLGSHPDELPDIDSELDPDPDPDPEDELLAAFIPDRPLGLGAQPILRAEPNGKQQPVLRALGLGLGAKLQQKSVLWAQPDRKQKLQQPNGKQASTIGSGKDADAERTRLAYERYFLKKVGASMMPMTRMAQMFGRDREIGRDEYTKAFRESFSGGDFVVSTFPSGMYVARKNASGCAFALINSFVAVIFTDSRASWLRVPEPADEFIGSIHDLIADYKSLLASPPSELESDPDS